MKKVVAAIDFGTSGTTYAFAFTDKRDNIVTGKWNINDEKNPSEFRRSKQFRRKILLFQKY